MIYAVDVTFDGNLDILIPYQQPASAAYFQAYVWDTETAQYQHVPSFENLPNVALDTSNKMLLAHRTASMITSYSMHAYDSEKKAFIPVRDLYWEPQENKQFLRVEETTYTGDGAKDQVKQFSVANVGLGLDKNDPQAAPYFSSNGLWDLDGSKWNNTVIPNSELRDAVQNQPGNETVDITALSFQEAYAYGVKQYEEHPEAHRDLGQLQPETQQIIELGGKYYQSYVSGSVDMRYIFISQPEFPDDSKALWDWYPIGTAGNYSLDLLGRISDGQSSSQAQSEIPESVTAILNNTQSFYRHDQQKMTLSDYHKTIWGITVVDMDADGSNEVALMFTDGNILLLRQQGEAVYGYDFGLHAMYEIYTDGTFLWNSDAGNIYGCSKLQFTGSNCETVELWRVEQDGSGSFTYYVSNQPVSKEQYDSQQTHSGKAAWEIWENLP